MTTRTIVAACVALLLILAAAMSGSPVVIRHLNDFSKACSALLRLVRNARVVWQEAGMRYKYKALVGFYQCMAAVPSVYNVRPPIGLEDYTQWTSLLELPSEFERIFQVHTALLWRLRHTHLGWLDLAPGRHTRLRCVSRWLRIAARVHSKGR
jgi:hypothetical protein